VRPVTPTSDRHPLKRTIRDVARRAGVSPSTVSRTINSPSLVDENTAERVLKAIKELNYYPNTQARSLVSGRSRIAGMIVSDITNPFFPELVKSFEDIAAQHGYDILVSSTNYDSARMAVCVTRMLERKVDGVAIMTSEMDHHLIRQLAHGKVPMVFLDTGPRGEFISNIVVDYAMGITEAVEHLVALGHRRIGFISGPPGLKSAQVRRSAFLGALDRYGLREDEALVQEGNHKVDGGLAAMTRMLEQTAAPTAMLASNDLTAIGMLSALRRAGLVVPRDISVVGFDDIWLAQFTEPPLTTVRLSQSELASKAFLSLLADIGGLDADSKPDCNVETHLVIRQTTCQADPTRVLSEVLSSH
jgi:DNA-binding LacI/PurR family transcriptional regulator